MATKKTAAAKKSDAKPRVRWPFPRATLEQALKIPNAIKDLNGGNPWEPEEIRKAIGAGTGGNAFFYGWSEQSPSSMSITPNELN